MKYAALITFLFLYANASAQGDGQVPRDEKLRTAEDQNALGLIQTAINWELSPGNTNGPTQIQSWTYPVFIGDGTVEAWRGPISANGCAAIAAAYAALGKEDAALSWAAAGQSHNAEAIGALYRAKWYTLRYLTTDPGCIAAGSSLVGTLGDMAALQRVLEVMHTVAFPEFGK